MSEFKFECLPHDICRVTSEFGYRTNPITGEVLSFHQGTDYGAKISGVEGDKLYAVADGKVVRSQNMPSKINGYGYHIVIQHIGACTLYGHMLGLKLPVGKKVYSGDTVGYMGSTGACTATHLHFEVEPIDYIKYWYKNSLGNRMYAVDSQLYLKAYLKELAKKLLEENDMTKLEELENKIDALNQVRYNSINEMPVYYRDTITDLVNRGIIKGNDTGKLNMSEDMIRSIIINHRDTVSLSK